MIGVALPDRIRLHNISDLQPRQRPPFPLDENDGDEINNLSRLHLDEDDDGEQVIEPAASQKNAFSPPLGGQDIIIPRAEHSLQAVALGCHGSSLIALGVNGQVWIWTNVAD